MRSLSGDELVLGLVNESAIVQRKDLSVFGHIVENYVSSHMRLITDHVTQLGFAEALGPVTC